MPGPVSDSYDPEWGTGSNSALLREALGQVDSRLTDAIADSNGSPEPKFILDVVRDSPGPGNYFVTDERCLRLLRFCVRRVLEEL